MKKCASGKYAILLKCLKLDEADTFGIFREVESFGRETVKMSKTAHLWRIRQDHIARPCT